MKGIASLMITAVTMSGLAASVHAGGQQQQALEQPATAQTQPADPAATTDPPGTPISQPTADQNLRLSAVVPAGMTTEEACAGFKDVGQCAAALHASRNLSIPFADLKTKITSGGRSLGAAIRDLKPDANATAEAMKAEEQANRDLHAPSG
jgi:uncharacterized iron-regulated membrane protein